MRIDWSKPAIEDLENIDNYISKDSEYYAIRFINKIILAVDDIIYFPRKGRQLPESDDPNIREIIFQLYRIIYRIEPERILIIGIIHSNRDLKNFDIKPWDII